MSIRKRLFVGQDSLPSCTVFSSEMQNSRTIAKVSCRASESRFDVFIFSACHDNIELVSTESLLLIDRSSCPGMRYLQFSII